MLNPKVLREKHGDSGRYVADATQALAAQFSVRTMNFGQHWRTDGIESVTFSVTLPSAVFVELTSSQLPEFIADMQLHPDVNDEFQHELRKLNWPTVTEILQHNKLSLFTLDLLAHEMLLRWFGDGEPSQSPGFILNAIDSTSFDDDNPTIAGTCRRAGVNVRYQDE